ncbi:MAG: hypothetical protein H7199_01655 [Burkholderiales bacterium]|nr:hypothetical protein [Flavobacterium sp.]
MEELDLLKKAWKKDGNTFEQLSEQDLYKMVHQKSSSIVKWILVISLIEFVAWNSLTFLLSDDQYQAKLRSYGMTDIMLWINIVNYSIVLLFIYLFYKNYKSISTTDSTQQLMQNILRTLKTVQQYIWYNLGIVTLSIVISIVMLIYHNPQMIGLFHKAQAEGRSIFFITLCTAVSIVFVLLIISIFWLFYKLLYGILLKKLLTNYKELKKIEL